jgi:hypothetical protein
MWSRQRSSDCGRSIRKRGGFKKTGSRLLSSQLGLDFCLDILRQLLITGDSSDYIDDDGGNNGARRTGSRVDNHNTDMVDSKNSDTDSSIRMGNIHIHNTPEIRTLFRSIHQRQSAAPEQKP